MIKAKTHNTIFLKISAVFLSVIFVLCGAYLYSYISSMRILEREKTSALYNAGISQIQMMDHQISNAKRALYNAYVSKNWDSLATTTGYIQDYTVLKQVVEAEERIRIIQTNNEIIHEVLIHFPRWGRTISSSEGLIDYDREHWENITMPQNYIGAQIVYHNGKAFLTSRYQITNPQLFNIDAELSFEKSFQSFGEYNMMGVKLNNYLFDVNSGAMLLKHENFDEATNEYIRQNIQDAVFTTSNPVVLKYFGKTFLVLCAASSYSNLQVVNVVQPSDLVKPFAKQRQLVILFTILISASIILVLLFVRHYIVNPIDHMIKAFKPVEKGDFSVKLQTNSTDEFALLYDSFNHMVENLQILVNEIYEKELLVQRANLKQLQSQINPHFLYNSLYALSSMIKLGDNENAEHFCLYLSSYFRYITRNGSDMETLADEWQHASVFLNIMTMRNHLFKLDFQQELPEEVKYLKVPRLIIQPIIENAFKHGSKTVANFHLKVSANCADGLLIIKVEDNGKGTSDQELEDLNSRLYEHQSGQEITALLNINKRLKLFFGSDSGLFLSRSALGGILVEVVLVLKGDDTK